VGFVRGVRTFVRSTFQHRPGSVESKEFVRPRGANPSLSAKKSRPLYASSSCLRIAFFNVAAENDAPLHVTGLDRNTLFVVSEQITALCCLQIRAVVFKE
jgi:hypothetical protein